MLPLLAGAACDRAANGAAGRSRAGGSHTQILDRTYLDIGSRDLRLDVYLPPAVKRPPTVLYFHGGGWTQGAKGLAVADLTFFLSAGWAVVSADYRLAPADPAPAAVEDATCALRWVAAHADEFGFDLRRLVVAGYSAGGHLALLLALLPDSLSYGSNCLGAPTAHPVAVLNLAGITDVGELLKAPGRREWAVAWIGDRLDRRQLAASVSPITWVRAGVPPVITVHGQADPVVPYEQALRFHQAMDRAGVPNRLCTVRGGGHDLVGSREAEHAVAIMTALVRPGNPSLDPTALRGVC